MYDAGIMALTSRLWDTYWHGTDEGWTLNWHNVTLNLKRMKRCVDNKDYEEFLNPPVGIAQWKQDAIFFPAVWFAA